MRPIIGITNSFNPNGGQPERLQSHLLAGYSDGIYRTGGLALALPTPPEPDPNLLNEIVSHCDGMVFTGGYDLDPGDYNQSTHPRTHRMHERRDAYELALFRLADAHKIPLFGICLGHQIAHVTRGGQLIQHIDDLDLTPKILHHCSDGRSALHDVTIAPDSSLARIVGGTTLEVTSRHHQIVDGARPGQDLRTVATSPDGVIEASEDCAERFLLTVQWHPEDLLDRKEHLNLFAALVEAAGNARDSS